MLLPYSSHHHAEVISLDDDGDAFGFQRLLECIADLLREALLGLESPCKHIDDTRDFAQAENFLSRNVSDMHFADEGEEVMLAETEALDVLHDHHPVGIRREERSVDNGLEILVVAFGEKGKGFRSACGGFLESFAVWIFADGGEERYKEILHRSIIGRFPSHDMPD